MNPAIENVMLGVLANVLTRLISSIGQWAGELLVGKDLVERLEQQKLALSPIIKKALEKVSEEMEWEEPPRVEEVCLFLASPESEMIVRQIFCLRLDDKQKTDGIEAIHQEFIQSFCLQFDYEQAKLARCASKLYKILLRGCDSALGIAIDKGILSAHEARSVARYRIVLDELATIHKNISFLSTQHITIIQDIHAFELLYRELVGTRHKYITPPDFDEARRISIDALYVPPNFFKYIDEGDRRRRALTSSEFLSTSYRAVLLGNPGGGKSTFAHKLCFDLASRYSHRLFAGRELTPVLVILRDFGTVKKEKSLSILQFISSVANSKYQIEPPPGSFEYLLLNGRVLVIFDGLDELLDTSYRQEISGDIESFCTLYPSVPVLVTSREVGYEQAPLAEHMFDIYRIAPFNEEQVKEYVTKWFSNDMDLDTSEASHKISSFIQESQSVFDLCSNPLLLALMCNIYKGENYLPRNRPDVYEKCANMLFERWDKSRNIQVLLPFETNIRPAMTHLAHWIYTRDELQSGVTEHELVETTTSYLSQRRYEEADDARAAAREFVRFCRGRAWVFTEVGTTKEGERLYQFSHRTFLEYFTAAYLFRTNPTPSQLVQVLVPKIERREWDVVAQLAFQIQNRNVEGAGDALLNAILDPATTANGQQRWNRLSFAARCLEFMVPFPMIVRRITEQCLNLCFSTTLSMDLQHTDTAIQQDAGPLETIGALLNACNENRSTVADCLSKTLVLTINEGSEPHAILGLEIANYLDQVVYIWQEERTPQKDLMFFWHDISRTILESCNDRFIELCPKDNGLCLTAFDKNKICAGDVIRWCGLTSIFKPLVLHLFPQIRYYMPARALVYKVMIPRQPITQDTLCALNDIGLILLTSPPPFINAGSMRAHVVYPRPIWDDKYASAELALDANALFGFFVLYATQIEASAEHLEKRSSPIMRNIIQSKLPIFKQLRWSFVARFQKSKPELLEKELEGTGFSIDQKEFVMRWITKKINLIDKNS